MKEVIKISLAAVLGAVGITVARRVSKKVDSALSSVEKKAEDAIQAAKQKAEDLKKKTESEGKSEDEFSDVK